MFRRSRPANIDRARRVGYENKQGYVVFSCKVRAGGRKRPCSKGIVYGKPTHHGINELKFYRSHQSVAEERVGRRCANLRVLNSYWVAQDADSKWFDVVLVDPNHKSIRNDPRINWICSGVHKHRECRGLTATGKKEPRHEEGHQIHEKWTFQVRPLEEAEHAP